MPQVKKISVATVAGSPDIESLVKFHEANGADATKPLVRIIGQAIGTKTGESTYGAWTGLLGRFMATNLETGEEVEASQCFLPEIALTPIVLALSNVDKGRSVTFAIDISCRMIPKEKRKPGGVPYEYLFADVVPPSDDDPLMKLKAQIAASPAALSFNKKPDAAPAPAPAAAKSRGK